MLSYDELLQKYKLLEQENKILKEQIAELQGKKYTLARNSESTITDLSDSKVTMKSTPQRKNQAFPQLLPRQRRRLCQKVVQYYNSKKRLSAGMRQ